MAGLIDRILVGFCMAGLFLLVASFGASEEPPPAACDNACRERRHHKVYKNYQPINTIALFHHSCIYCKSTDGLCYATTGDHNPTGSCVLYLDQFGMPLQQYMAVLPCDSLCSVGATTKVAECVESIPNNTVFLEILPEDPEAPVNWKRVCPQP